MSFDRSDIRKAMDVYTADNVYLGTVLKIVAAPVHDEQRSPTIPQQSAISGELLGPMPTLPIGNRAAELQSASHAYGSAPDQAQPLGHGQIIVGSWWGLVGRRTIPLDQVQTVSLERIVLRQRSDEIDR